MPNIKTILFCYTLACPLLAGIPAGANASGKDGQTVKTLPTVTVQTAQVVQQAPDSKTQVTGTIQSVHRATIAAKVTGTIEEIPVRLGSRVNKGDLLVRISAGEIEARLDQAQAQLAQAERNLERERNLLQKKAATQETVRSMQDARKIAEAAYQEARTMQEYVRITAPFSGVITAKPANVGDLASPGAPLIQIENIDQLQVVTAIPEALLLRVQIGDILPVTVPSAGLQLEGAVAEIAPAVDPLSRTAPVKLHLPGAESLRPGQFARIGLPTEQTSSLFVPRSALHSFGQMEQVFVVRGNQVDLRLVRSGSSSGELVEILSGLAPDEQVVIRAEAPLNDNQPIHRAQ